MNGIYFVLRNVTSRSDNKAKYVTPFISLQLSTIEDAPLLEARYLFGKNVSFGNSVCHICYAVVTQISIS